jgi:hypothetical protein
MIPGGGADVRNVRFDMWVPDSDMEDPFSS